MQGDGTQNFTVAGSALRCKAHLCNCYELGDLLLTANAICFKQETGTLHYNTVHSLNERAIQGRVVQSPIKVTQG